MTDTNPWRKGRKRLDIAMTEGEYRVVTAIVEKEGGTAAGYVRTAIREATIRSCKRLGLDYAALAGGGDDSTNRQP